jgi:molecular chaperone DnaJ
MKNYYNILEVEENASDEEIKKSYRNLSKKFHPDVNPQGAEKFKEINEAYEILGNKEKKQTYDFQRKNPFQGSQFESFFDNMFNRQQQPQRKKSAPDKIIKLQISPIESYLGLEKEIQYTRDLACNSCGGSGGDKVPCSHCSGYGFHIKTFGTGFMVQQIRTVCPTCNGQGQMITERCYLCGGRGTSQTVSDIRIKIPTGCDNGQFLKLQSLGDFKNGDVGDLVIQIELIPKDGFEKLNNDLIYNLFLDLSGVTQEKYIIPHPDGNLSMDAPKIFDTSRPLRLRGKGYNGGDMYIKLNVKFQRPV